MNADPHDHALVAEELRVDYGDFTAVDQLSFALPPGAIFGLVGPNGAGKTSTIRVLATLMEPTYGRVTLGGWDLAEEPARAQALLGYMPDLAPVIPDLTIQEFLAFYAAGHGLPRNERAGRVEACLRQVGLWDRRKTLGKALSRGMAQRVILAKTLLHRPRVLLLDEPASGMDPIARAQLQRTLRELSAEGATVLISSHILSELAQVCTLIGIMHKGRMRAFGTVDEITASTHARAYELSFRDLAPDLGPILAAHADWYLERTDDPRTIRVTGPQNDDEAHQLLRAVVAAGHPVVEYRARRRQLEDILTELHADPADEEAAPDA